MGSQGGPRHQVETTEASSPSGRHRDRALAPVVTRVDTDPSQTHAWQKESVARHMTDAPYSNNQNTPPHQQTQQYPDIDAHPMPHRNGNGTPDSQRSRREYRNSGWGSRQNGGSVGVTGAT